MTDARAIAKARLEEHPRLALGTFPTPLLPAPALFGFQGPEVFIKRDDLTGLAVGGNKARKLEFLVGDALEQGADTLVTGGAAQSNHCLQTAAAATRAGMECHLALAGEKPEELTGNLLLDTLLGANLHFCGEQRKGESLGALGDELTKAGRTPYLIPYGGSNPVGALGFVVAGLEIAAQLEVLPRRLTHLFIATSSAGTQAGLLAAKALFDLPYEVWGVGVDREDFSDNALHDRIEDLARRTVELLAPGQAVVLPRIRLLGDYLGKGYGVLGDEEREAIGFAARKLGFFVDPVYTGRAFFGLMSSVRRNLFSPEERIVFWHTGGIPAIFHYGTDLLAGSVD